MIRARLVLLALILLLPFGAIVLQLARLQLDAEQHAYYTRRAEHARTIYTRERRGRILARGGEVLAGDETVFRVELSYYYLDGRASALAFLERALARACDGVSLRREDIVATLRAEAPPSQLARTPPAPADWRPLLELSEGCAERLAARLADGRYDRVFEVRAAEGGARWELWFEPRRLLRLEIAMERLAMVLARSSGSDRPDASELLARVEARRVKIEARLAEIGEDDRRSRVREAQVTEHQRLVRRELEAEFVPLVEEVSADVVTALEYYPELFPPAGLRVASSARRVYPEGELTGTITGYLRALAAKDIEEARRAGRFLSDLPTFESTDALRAKREGLLRHDDRIGASGLEAYYDEALRGAPGMERVRLDNRGRPAGQLVDPLPPQDGEDIRTSIDLPLQRALHERLLEACADLARGQRGAVVVLAVPGGEVLAMAGYPGYDPNRIGDDDYREAMNERWGEKSGWLLDRATRHPLPPGSVFKLVWAAAALEAAARGGFADGVQFSPVERYPCSYQFEDTRHRCNSRSGHYEARGIDLVASLRYSCNSYYYNLAKRVVPLDVLRAQAEAFGFGRWTDIDLPPSRIFGSGLLDAPDDVPPGGELYYAIGQVHVLATPLQVARAVAALAAGDGRLPRPALVPARHGTRGDPLPLGEPTLRLIRRGMWDAVHRPRGTAEDEDLGLREFRVAVKTGTAEFEIDKDEKTNIGWLAGYAPAGDPEEDPTPARVAFAVVVERTDEHGGDACAPIVRALLEHLETAEPGNYRLHGAESP